MKMQLKVYVFGILFIIFILNFHEARAATTSSTSYDSSSSSEFTTDEEGAIIALYNLSKQRNDKQEIIKTKEQQENLRRSKRIKENPLLLEKIKKKVGKPNLNFPCGSIQNPHSKNCQHWKELTISEKKRNQARMQKIFEPEKVRIRKNAEQRRRYKRKKEKRILIDQRKNPRKIIKND